MIHLYLNIIKTLSLCLGIIQKYIFLKKQNNLLKNIQPCMVMDFIMRKKNQLKEKCINYIITDLISYKNAQKNIQMHYGLYG